MPPRVPAPGARTARLARWQALPLRIPSPDVNAPDDMGRTRLFHAARGGHTETVWTLLRECAADPRGHALSARPEQNIAFAMALHGRLGRDSLASALPPELLTLAWEAGLDVMGFLEQVRTSCGPQSL